MAIITLGGGVASISGSVAGTTFSRNRGGPYMRTRAIPTNPNTPAQQAVRSFLAQLAVLWTSLLTSTQREAWDTYALNVPLPNSQGEPRNVGGVGMYQRSNVTRLQAGLARVDDGPTIPTVASMTLPVVSGASVSTNSWSLAFDNTDDWANEDGGALICAGSRSRSIGINYFKGPYRFTQVVLGNATTPPTSPVVITNPFLLILGQKVFAKVVVVRADGRVGGPFRGESGIAA